MDINKKSLWYSKKLISFNGGFLPLNHKKNSTRRIFNIEPWDLVRRDMILLLLKDIEENKVEGAFAELGVYKGSTARLIHHYSPYRKFYLFDTFDGFTGKGVETENLNTGNSFSYKQFSDTSIDKVKNFIDPQNSNLLFYPGYFPDSISDKLIDKKFSFVHIDADLYQPIMDGLLFFYKRLSPGGVILVHDFHAWPGAYRAVKDFSSKHKVPYVPMPDKSGSAVFKKDYFN